MEEWVYGKASAEMGKMCAAESRAGGGENSAGMCLVHFSEGI
jgi:hypothetical protein